MLGIDMMYAFLKHLYGESDPVLVATMNAIEYAPHTDPSWDPFAIVHNVCTYRSPQTAHQLINDNRCLGMPTAD